jgi:hypothetical protein
MSVDSVWDVQTGVYGCLTANAGLTDLLAAGANGVLDHVPPGTEFPYVVIGESSARPMDSQGVSGNDVILAIHTYSRGSGMQQVRHIMSAVYDALHNASFAVPHQALILCQCLGAETFLEGDGMTRHGAQRFQIITEPV